MQEGNSQRMKIYQAIPQDIPRIKSGDPRPHLSSLPAGHYPWRGIVEFSALFDAITSNGMSAD
jgi:hypothetical protein